MISKILSIGAIYTLSHLLPAFHFASYAATPALGGPESVESTRHHPVIGTRGMVVSDDRIASEWGAEILKKGGNAVDAAIATAFALAVTRPHYASLGGGGFFLYCPRPSSSGPSACSAIDYREEAPATANSSLYIRNRKATPELAQNGALASGVPATPAGLLLALRKFGTLSRQTLLRKPIEIAKKGYVFTSHSEAAALQRWPFMNSAAKQIFGCRSGKNQPLEPCAPGTLIRQPDLAKVLETLSKKGERGFYEGPVAQLIVKGLQKEGGILSLQDLRSYSPKLRTPLIGHYEGNEIISMPPPSSGGGVLLEMLGFATRADQSGAFKAGFGSAQTIHALIHSMSLGFVDRALHYGDPDFVTTPLAALLKPNYLNKQWQTFNPDSASIPEKGLDLKNRAISSEGQHTTHFSVIDSQGNAVAITTTINDNFGSGFVPPGSGIVMNNEMDDFSIQPGVPNQFNLVGTEANAIAPKKRPLSSMTPTIVRDSKGNNRIVIGAAGGPRITTSVFLSLVNRLRFNLPLSDAVAAARFHHQWKPETVFIEKFGFSPEVRSALEKKGYKLSEVATLAKIHALERFPNGRSWGFADLRGEGEAVAE